MWSSDAILDAVHAALMQREEALRLEQAVAGLDALDEVGLHPILESGITGAGFGVLREQPYPHEWKAGRRARAAAGDEPLPQRRDRLRCDLVLTPGPGAVLGDSLENEKTAVAIRRRASGTLFEAVAVEQTRDLEQLGPAGAIQPEDAYWLEVKVVAQYTFTSGVPGPNRTYASELTRGTISDLAKLAADERILHAGMLMVLFAADRETAEHDLNVVLHRVLDKELPIQSPLMRSLPIVERIGNSVCTACLIGVRA